MPTKTTSIRHDVKWTFATVLRACRGRLGISQEELAGRAGLHRTYMSDIERGARNLSLESIDKLAKPVDFLSFTRVTPRLSLQWALVKSGSRAFSTGQPRAGPALG